MKHSQSGLFVTNALVMWGAKTLQIVPSIVLVPYLIREIGEYGYGIYALVWSLLLAVDQLEKSLQSGVIKYCAGFLAQNQMGKVNKVVSTGFVYSFAIGVLAGAGTVGVAFTLKGYESAMKNSLLMVGIMIVFIVPVTPYVAVIQARQRYYISAVAETVSKYLSLFLVFVSFSVCTPSVEILVIIMAGSLLLSRVAQIPVAYRMVKGLRNHFRFSDKQTFRLLASFGAATVMIALCLTANTTGLRWLMNYLASTRFLAHLAILLMPGILLNQVVSAMTVTAMPAASAFEASADWDKLRTLMMRGIRYTVTMVSLGLIQAVFLLKPVLKIWVGSEYLFLSAYILVLLFAGGFMQCTSISHHILKGLGRIRTVVLIYFFGLVIIPLVAIVILQKMTENPYLAVTTGLSAGYIACAVLNIILGFRVLKLNFFSAFAYLFGQPVLSFLLAVVPAALLAGRLEIYGLLENLLVSLLSTVLFIGLILLFFATPSEKGEARRLMQRIVSWVR